MFTDKRLKRGPDYIGYVCFWLILGVYLVPTVAFRSLRFAVNYLDRLTQKWLYG